MQLKTSETDAGTKLEIIMTALEDKKAVEPDVMEIQGKTLIADFFVVTHGTSSLHMRALADGVVDAMRNKAHMRPRREGDNDANWMLLDYGDVVVHIFSEEARGTYDLDSLWRSTEERLGPDQDAI